MVGGYAKLRVVEKECINVHVWCHEMDWHPDKGCIQHDSDEDKAITED